MSEQLRQRLTAESDALFGTARLWDDGIIDPRDTPPRAGLTVPGLPATPTRAPCAPTPSALPACNPHFSRITPGDSHAIHPEHEQIRDTVRKFVAKKSTRSPEWEKAGIFPAHQLFKKLGDLGLLGIKYPTEFGGMGLDFSYSMVMAEALGDSNVGGVPMAIGVQTDMCTPAGPLRQRRAAPRIPRPSIAGDMVGCIGVSEVRGGSDVAALKTTARKDGGDYVINGSKMWITNGMQADWCCLLANTSEGPVHKNKSLIIGALDAPGRHRQKIERSACTPATPRSCSSTTCACPSATCHRPGRHGLHVPDAAVPGRAPVRCRQVPLRSPGPT